MAQPNKVDFDVRKLLKRKEVSSEYSREVTVSVTMACSYSEFSCSYSFQLPRASVPPPTAGEGAAGRRCGPRVT